MSSLDFGAMCEDAAERLYLEHHGIKGMKWGIRRFQNEDGTLTPEGKERYKSIMSGGKSKAADEFYRKAVAKDSIDNFLDLRSSLPVQHAVSKLRNDSEKYYEKKEETNRQREKLIREGYDKLSAEEKDRYVNKAIKACIEYNKNYYEDHLDPNNPVDYDKLWDAADADVEYRTNLFNSKDRGFSIDDYIMEHKDAGFYFTAYGQWYAEHNKDVNAALKPYTDAEDKIWQGIEDNCRTYIQEFTKGFGQYELKDLSKKYGRKYTVDDKLEATVRDTFYNFGNDYGMLVATDETFKLHRPEVLKEQRDMFDQWRREAFKKNGMTKLY